MMGQHKGLHMVAFILLVVGGLNWGLSVWNYDLSQWGLSMTVLKVVYVLVGLSAIYEVATHGGRCKECSADKM